MSLVLLRFVPWELAVVLGWDTAALAFLMSTSPIISRAGSGQTKLLAGREDQKRGLAAVLLIEARPSACRPPASSSALPASTAVHGDSCPSAS